MSPGTIPDRPRPVTENDRRSGIEAVPDSSEEKMAGRMTRHFKHIVVCRIKLFSDNFELECSLDILVAFYGSLVNAGLLYSV